MRKRSEPAVTGAKSKEHSEITKTFRLQINDVRALFQVCTCNADRVSDELRTSQCK